MTEIAHGSIGLDLNDKDVIAGLRAVDSEFSRTMDKIDRERATATADLNIDKLEEKAKSARKELKVLEGLRATAELDADKDKLDRAIKVAQAEVKKLDGEKAVIELEVRGNEALRKAHQDEQRRQEQTARAAEQAMKRRLAAAQQEAREEQRMIQQRSRSSLALRKQKEQEMRASERAAYAENTARTQAERDRQRQMDALPKLREEYVKLAQQVEGFDAKRRKAGRAGDAKAVLLVDIQQENALARMKAVKEELERVGSPIDVDVDVHPGRDFGLTMKRAFQDGGLSGAAYIAGATVGDKFVAGFNARRSKLNKTDILAGVGAMASRGIGRIGSMFEGLSNATVRLGPFTASIKQALVGLSVLGPTILDITGALGSLVGVVGSGALGLGALGTAVVGGAIPALAGMFAVLKPVKEQFSAAMKASDAYQAAVLKHGKGSEQAAKKSKELAQTLKGVDKETVKNFKAAGNLAGRWEKLTAPARASAFKVIGEGLKFASDNMGWFGRQTNRGMGIAQKSISRMISGLNSGEGRNILGSMMSNFNSALGPALDGLANIGTYLGRVGRIASGYLPGMANQFKNWSQALADGGANSEVLGRKIKTTIDSLRSVGRFAMAGGRLLKAFFGGGVESGTKLVDTMTNAMNRWTAFLNTTKGQNRLGEFFDRAVNGTQALYSALAPIISSFVGWASAMSPIVTTFFRGAAAVGNFVAALLRVTALQGPITALAGTLGALWAVGKIGAAVQMVGNFTRALIGLKTASTGLAAAQGGAGVLGALGGAAGSAGMAGRARQIQQTSKAMTALNVASAAGAGAQIRWGAAAARAAPAAGALGTRATAAAGGVGLMRGAATALIPAIGSMGAIAGGAATAGVGLLAAGAVYGAYKLVTMKSEADKAKESLSGLGRQSANYRQVAAEAGNQMGDLGSQFTRSKIAVQQTAATLRNAKKGTMEYKLALMDHRDALRQNEQAGRQWSQVTNVSEKANARAAATDRKREEIGRKLVKLEKDKSAMAGQGGEGAGGSGLSDHNERLKQKRVEELRGKYRQLSAEIERNKNVAAAASVNVQRGLQGGANYAGKAAQEVGKFTRQFSKVPNAKKLVVNADTTKAGAGVAKISNQLSRVGQKKTAVNIVSNSRSAEQALARLQKAKIATKKLTIIERGGKEAVSTLQKIIGRKLTTKEQRIATKGGPAAVAQLNKLTGMKLQTKTQRIMERGSNAVRSAISAITGMKIPNKSTTISAKNNAGGVISSIIGMLGSIPRSITSVINVVRRGKGNADGGTFADGGETRAYAGGGDRKNLVQPDPRRIERARREAEARQPVDARSGGRKISRPTLLTGEENSPEFVIASNPAYRKRNVSILKTAASALGVPVYENERAARGDIANKTNGRDEGLVAAAAGYNPSLTVRNYSGIKTGPARTQNKRKSFEGRVKGKKKKFPVYNIASNPYPSFLNKLDTQQENLERELSLREGAVQEPEDFLIETKDPKTGDITYSYDKAAWNAWKPQMDQVREVYNALIRTTEEITQTIPKAKSFTNAQISGNKRNIAALEFRLAKARKRAAKKGNSANAKRTRAQGAKDVAALEKKLTGQREALRGRQEFRDTLDPRLREAGFDYREYLQERGDHDFDVTQKSEAGQADEIAEGNFKPTDQGGGGDAPVPNLSYGQQVAAAAAEKASVLREFAGNATATAGANRTAMDALAGAFGANPAATASPASAGGAAIAAMTGAGASGGGGTAAGAAIASLAGGGGAAASGRAASAGAGTPAAPASGGTTEVNINNTFATAPADPHTWSKGVEFEIGAAL